MGLADLDWSIMPGPHASRIRIIAFWRAASEEAEEGVLDNGVPIGFAGGAIVICSVGKLDLLGRQFW